MENIENQHSDGCSPGSIEPRKAMLLTGLLQSYTYDKMDGIGDQWHRFVPRMGEVQGIGGRVAYGVVLNTSESGCDYMTAVEVSDVSALPQGFESLELPAQQYAIFPHTGHLTTMPKTINNIFHKWLPQSGRQTTGRPRCLERYGEGFNPDTGSGDIEIWVPLKD